MSRSARRSVDILKGVIRGIQSDNITFIAASLSYYAFISLIPLLLLALVVANVVGGAGFEDAIVELAESNLPSGGDDSASTGIADVLTNDQGQTGASIVALITLTWSGLKLFRGMDVGFSIAYRSALPDGIVGQLKRGFITLLAVGGGVVFTVAVGTVIALSPFDLVVAGYSAIGLLGTLALLAGLTVTFLPLYYVLPNADITVREALPGAAFAAVGWTALQTGFRLYTEFSTGYEAYGVLAGALLLLTFLYFGALVVLTGVVLNAVLAGRVSADEDFDTDPSQRTQTNRSLMADTSDTTSYDTTASDDEYGRPSEMAEDDLEAEVRRLRREVRSFEERIEERTVHRDELESDLRKYVRQRVRRGKARGWGPYLVLLYGTVMTLGAFFFLQDAAWAAVLAMIVVWLSTLGLYVVFVVLGVTFGALGLPGKLLDRVRSFRN
ncbi:YhjD/YihY/BrkB family envelope integrity protein [Halomarina oriensis]|uniref:YihY family inner membrane protein n=1 Tax=Halomarina oriensis TaxID=671145 RepID=A0A6B0GMF8_9EURY|nr:YihY family inner membrane protein [Halomarina oriensis]